eukprot:CAMPEP_0116853420 /NCGR_PEP_ID=MMETSP0418-20121206/17902_1 /TAXON_ID=1158023 /ORGANISM="Astrosyne radiata, Strain 13vi08-1A" /LENGTH=379 /DNA_ID=CAMNT_0004485819 /DNA_START=116 /DNA_END=1255 /DNA_ORIENTATION=+
MTTPIERRRESAETESTMTRRRSLQRRTTIEEIESWTRTENKKEDNNNNKDNDDNDVVSVGSLSTVEDLLQEDPLLMAVEDSIMAVEDSLLPPEEENESLLLQPPPPPLPEVVKFPRQQKTLDVAKYMAEREMTPMQERMNALTMIPNPIYCFYFIVASLWLSDMQEDSATSSSSDNASDASCLEIPLLPRLHAMPPLTIMAIALGITLHAPFSFLYHWKYASSLPPGLPRTNHWSRRMDQSFIHVCSALMAFGTTGSWDYFFVNVLFNCDCIYRQFKKKVRPRRNQIRIGLSILAYTLPILRRGDVVLFSQCWFVLGVAGWFFVKYPLGGWSHSAFHLVISLLPPLLMKAACKLPSSHDRIQVAAQCAALVSSQGGMA